jgi:hypothetical protein
MAPILPATGHRNRAIVYRLEHPWDIILFQRQFFLLFVPFFHHQSIAGRQAIKKPLGKPLWHKKSA